ncbi:MAG: hypothetical protein DRZ90_04230 [Spirochaetes bacterium]|nr:MAG: hypothetical protein DRZ90_04230 [Spirochaetota bacterium]
MVTCPWADPWTRSRSSSSLFRGGVVWYETILSLHSFGSGVVPEARAEKRSRQNEQVHSAHTQGRTTA